MKHKSKTKRKTMKKTKKTMKKTMKKKEIKKGANIKMYGGNGGPIQDKDIFFSALTKDSKKKLETMIMVGEFTDNLETIKNKYKAVGEKKLYDFIYTNNNGQYELNTIWDHVVGVPESITAGLSGIHIYAIKNDNNEFEIIGKFERK
jgi:hypothetical protein